MKKNQELPLPKFSAVTEHKGLQSIPPHDPLHATIVEHLNTAAIHPIVATGDILFMDDNATCAVDPETVGIDREVINGYTTPERIAKRGLEKLFQRNRS